MRNINNINDHNRIKSNWKNIGYASMMVALLSMNTPVEAKNYNMVNSNEQLMEVLDAPNFLNNIEKRIGVKIPKEYISKINNFVATNEIMKSPVGSRFTEDFIVEQMQYNRGINRENQLLFVCAAVYKQITNQDLYDGSDGDDGRLEEFANVIDNIEKCGKDYVNGFNAYMERVSDEANRRSEEANRKYNEIYQSSVESLTSSLDNLVRFYDRYKRDPSTIGIEELGKWKELGMWAIQRCIKRGIDYKKILPEEVRKFYGIE